jgi:hypothetical protein
LGVTPSAWTLLSAKAIQVGPFGSLSSSASATASTDVGHNIYGSYSYLTSNPASFYRQNQGAHQWFTAPSGTAGNAITFTQAMTLDAAGNWMVGATSALGRATIVQGASSNADTLVLKSPNSGGAGSQPGIQFLRDTNAVLAKVFADTNTGALITDVNGAERARIDSSGNLLVGTTSASVGSGPGIKSLPAGDGADLPILGITTGGSTSATAPLQIYSTGAGAYRFYVSANGQINATSTTISAISDIRFKENVRDLDVGLNAIMALKPRLYDWKEGKGADIKNARGFIAQEFEEIFPDLIDEWRDPAPEGEEPYKSVRADLIPVLVKAIQEQQALITAQQAALETLTARVAALEGVQP